VENEREELHYRLARLLAIANDRAASTQALVLAREINPRYLPVLVSLGGVFAEDGKLDEALECINDAKRVSAAEPKLSLLRAQLLVCLQRPDEAMEELKLSFSRGILTEEGLSLLTKLVTERGGEVDPIPYLRTLVEYRPSALDARFSLVQALIAQEQLSDALHELNIALSLSPNETLRGMFLALRWKIESFLHEVAR
jgi:tetratricopeptide (TPR) repeat protein